MNVYTYWEGRQPPWIDLCLDSIQRNTPSAIVINPRTWPEYCRAHAALAAKVDKQAPNVKSDFIRASLLYHHGGIWVDADCICFKDLRQIAEPLAKSDFVAYRANGAMCTALIASKPYSDTSRHYLSIMEQKLHNAKGKLRSFGALGPNVLARAHRLAGKRTHILPQRLVHPHAHWLENTNLWQLSANSQPTIDPDAYCFMLTHRALGPFRNLDRRSLMKLDHVVGRAFRKAMSAPGI